MGLANLILTAATPSEQIVTALTSGFSDAATAMVSGIVAIIPIAVPVLGGILTVGFGIKVFKKLIGRA